MKQIIPLYLTNDRHPVRVDRANTTVKATRAIAMGLDGATNVHDTAGEFKVFGDMEVTGDLVVEGVVSGDISPWTPWGRFER